MEDSANHEYWRHWLHMHGPRLLFCARLWTRSLADAEDVVQEAFVRFWRHQRHLGGEPQALLLTSIRRAAIDLGRRETRRVARERQAEEGAAGLDLCFEPAGIDAARQAVLEDAIRRLPLEQREVLALKIWGELTFEQIAAQLDISPNTAASRYRYALTSLRKNLNPPRCHE